MHQKLKLRDLTSGQALRNYRRRLAASAGKPAASVLTTKFKLDMPQDCPLAAPGVFEKYRGLYDVIEGCGSGTLTHFLFTALLSGFRVFGTAPEASLFSTRQSYDEEGFRDALTEAVGAPLPGFTVASLLKRLATIPRARANAASGRKKDISFNTEVMTQEYRKALCPKPPQQADSACVDRLLESIAQRLTQRFTSWKDVAQNPFEACQSIDDALKGFADFPSLAAMVEARKGELPANSTIAFDSSLPLIELSEEFERLAPHAVVSLILSYPESQDGSARASFVSSHLTTSKGAGLSWLFNKGLDLFRSHSVDDLAAQYGVPEKDKDKLARVKKAAEAIPVQDLFYGMRVQKMDLIDRPC